MKFLKEIFKSKIRVIIGIAIVILILLMSALFIFGRRKEIDTTYIIAQLEKSSELTTAKLKYKGFSKFEDKGIILLNRSDFLMVYAATARAGIDVKEVKVVSEKITKTVKVKIPKAKILDVNVDPTSIKYYDEKFALFNFNSKEDANRAQALAEEKAREELANMGILEMADEQAEVLIKGLLQDTIPNDYNLVVERIED